MATSPIGARHFLLSCYVVSLIQGKTIKKIRIRHATLRGYLARATHLHLQRQLPDPTEPTFLDGDDLISPLLNAVRAYEQVTDRKEMIFDSMIAHMLLLGKLAPPNSLHSALVDWIILGRVTGVRRSEWCQDGSNIEMTIPTLAHEVPEPKAFLAEDFTFFDDKGNRIYTLTDKHLSAVDYVNIRWRFQKNGDNGQVIPYKRDYDRPDVCPVMAAFRIIRRAQDLDLPSSLPVAIYASGSSSASTQYKHIQASQVVKFLRTSAQSAFKLSPTDKSLQRWTCHSIRITAANLLHRAGMADSYIQTRLRWKSNTFLMYLRNTFYSADKHTAALKLSNIHLPQITTGDGLRHRPLEAHEALLAQHAARAA